MNAHDRTLGQMNVTRYDMQLATLARILSGKATPYEKAQQRALEEEIASLRLKVCAYRAAL